MPGPAAYRATSRGLCSNPTATRLHAFLQSRRARRLLIRRPQLLDEASRQRLRALLARNPKLATVVEFRERLQALWEGRQVSNERLIAQLKEWCAQAEASGIKVLQDYARALKHYTVAPA